MDPTSGPRVLLVEDNDDIRDGLSTLLDSEGYAAVAVSTAEDGLCQLQAQEFPLVITDYMLPGQSGGWMLKQAIAQGLLTRTRVVMITAHPRVVPPPGVRILHKPLDINEFLSVVEQEFAALPRHQAQVG